MTWPQPAELIDLAREWILQARWFPSDSLEGAEVAAWEVLTDRAATLVVRLPDGVLVQVPLALSPHAAEAIAPVGEEFLVDGTCSPHYVRAWIERAEVVDEDTRKALSEGVEEARPLGQEQSNSSVLIPGRCPTILKFFRVLVFGNHPEIEIPQALSGEGFARVPAPVASAYLEIDGARAASAAAARLVPDATDGFVHIVAAAREGRDASADLRDLGQVTRAMHDALARTLGEGDEPMSGGTLAMRLHSEARLAIAASPRLAADTDTLHHIDACTGVLQALGELPPTQRIHGDYHLGQCLRAQDGWYILDFEGEPLRPLEERTQPDQPLRDVAGIVRSLDYARAVAEQSPDWFRRMLSAFLTGYFGGDEPPAALSLLLHALVIEKALYEIRYEAQHRPDWETIPYEALLAELDSLRL